MAGRLGIPLAQLPDDPAEMVKAINQLVQRGSSRITATLPGQPGPFTPEGEATVLDYPTSADSGPSASDRDTWNPNGFDSAITFDNLWEKLRPHDCQEQRRRHAQRNIKPGRLIIGGYAHWYIPCPDMRVR